jgi:hypothetical protein
VKKADIKTIVIVALGVALGLLVFKLIKKLLVALVIVGAVFALFYFLPKRGNKRDAGR